MLRRMFPRRVVTGLVVAVAFVGVVIGAGYGFRHRHTPRSHRTPATSAAPSTPGGRP